MIGLLGKRLAGSELSSSTTRQITSLIADRYLFTPTHFLPAIYPFYGQKAENSVGWVLNAAT